MSRYRWPAAVGFSSLILLSSLTSLRAEEVKNVTSHANSTILPASRTGAVPHRNSTLIRAQATNRVVAVTSSGTSFVDIAAGLPDSNEGTASWCDFDNDGDLDLLLTGSQGGISFTRLFDNTGGTFTDTDAGLIGVSEEGCAAWADYDNDAWVDLGITGEHATLDSSTYHVIIYHNTGGTLRNANISLPDQHEGILAWGDYDNDGRTDLLICGSPDGSTVATTTLYRNSSGTFTDAHAGLPGLRAAGAAWGDFNNDGTLDLLLSGTTTGSSLFTGIYSNINYTFSDIAAGLSQVGGELVLRIASRLLFLVNALSFFRR